MPSKKVYKSFELSNLGLKYDFFNEFFEKIINEIDKINFFYSFFPNKPTKEEIDGDSHVAPIWKKIRIYPNDGQKEITSIEFLSKHLHNSFPHVCAWELYTKCKYEGVTYLDDFSGKITRAWEEIKNNEKIFVLPNGDKCNALISTADILLKYFDKISFSEKKHLNPEDIKTIFGEKTEIFFISTACLYNIIPLSSKSQIDKYSMLIHPVVFILNEKTKFVGRNAIENSPLLNKIIDSSFDNDGCFKLFDPESDYNFIHPDDCFVFFGEEGKKSVESLKNLGYDFKSVLFNQL